MRPHLNDLVKTSRIPLWVKLAYSAFVAVLVPYYWKAYGPTNFLYFCDVALLMALLALWMENSLLASMPTVGIPITGMTAYMFNPELTLFTRGLSFFHCWLPFFLVWVVWRLGYDRRAFV